MGVFKFVIRGTRGSMPACGRDYVKYGGNTTCFSIQTDGGLIIFDAGTGILHVANDLAGFPEMPSITMFFTHFHMDHVIGLPRFDPLYSKQTTISIMADHHRGGDWKKTLRTFMGKPYWPVGLGECDAVMKLEDLPAEQDGMELYGVRISWFHVPHPQQCLAYRVEMPGNVVVIATDVEYDANRIPPDFIEFCRNADFLVYDTQYTPEEYAAHRGWGHSTWETGARIAGQAEVGRLILSHHAPDRKDREIDRIAEDAKKVFSRSIAATENMVLG